MSLVPVEAEQAVLGAALLGEWCEECEAVRPVDFGEPRNATVWAAILWVRGKGRAVTHLAVAERLKDRGELADIGGPAFLNECDSANTVGPGMLGVGLPGCVATVLDRASRRAVVMQAQAAIARAHDTNLEPARVALESSNALAELGAAGASTDFTFRDAMVDFIDRSDRIQNGTWKQYQPTYVGIWDEVLGGLERGKLILIGAFPSVGKSALEATILLERAKRGHRDGIFTLEDPKIWLAKRYVAKATGIPVRRLMQSPTPGQSTLSEWWMKKIEDAYHNADEWCDRMRIDERPSLSAYQIATKARQWVKKHGVESVWIDNASEVDLSEEPGDRHDLKTSNMVRTFRNIAKVMDIPVVLLVHFKKPSNSSKEPRFIKPTSDLWKNSGAFAEAARVAVALYQDEAYAGAVMGTVLKQTEGKKDVEFMIPMHEPSGLLEAAKGAVVGQDAGYSGTMPDPSQEAA
jgi:replicative DNA helicase